jgi:hypothetical protein
LIISVKSKRIRNSKSLHSNLSYHKEAFKVARVAAKSVGRLKALEDERMNSGTRNRTSLRDLTFFGCSKKKQSFVNAPSSLL